MSKANVWLQFQYCTCVCWCVIYVCSQSSCSCPRIFLMQLQYIMYPNTDVEVYIYKYIFVCIHLVWGYSLVWGYCIANQNHCMTTNLCLGFLFWKHTAFNQTQTMVGTTWKFEITPPESLTESLQQTFNKISGQ